MPGFGRHPRQSYYNIKPKNDRLGLVALGVKIYYTKDMPNNYHRILKGKSTEYLLGLYAEVIQHLRDSNIVRTSNNPTGDYAEYVACKLFKLTLAPNSTKSYDAVDKLGKRYQIKARRMTRHNHTQLLGVMRDLPVSKFHYLIVVIFNEDFSVNAVYKMRKNVVPKYARFRQHQNGYVLNMRGKILLDRRVEVKRVGVRGSTIFGAL